MVVVRFLLSRRMLASGGMGKSAVRGLWVGTVLAGGSMEDRRLIVLLLFNILKTRDWSLEIMSFSIDGWNSRDYGGSVRDWRELRQVANYGEGLPIQHCLGK